MVNNNAWYSSIARVVAIFIAVGLYGIALLVFFRRSKKKLPMRPADADKKNASYIGPERRIYPRAKLDVVVRYKLSGLKGVMHVFKEGRIKDISEGGLLLVEAQEELAVDSVVELKFRLPNVDHYILLRGNIVWNKEVEPAKLYDYGVSILHIESNDRKSIAKYVAAQQVKGHEV